MIHYRIAYVDNHKSVYREAGEPSHPTILRLHGFPTTGDPAFESRRYTVPDPAKGV